MDETPPKVPPRTFAVQREVLVYSRKKSVPEEERDSINYYYQPNTQRYTIREFFNKFSELLPVFAVATEGNLGRISIDTIAADQTLFCHRYVKQLRVVARDARNRMYSIPEDYDVMFQTVISSEKVGKEQSLAEILSENKLPVQVRFCVQEKRTLQIESDVKRKQKFTNLLLVDTFYECTLLAAAVYGRKVEKKSLIVPLYLDDLEVATVRGIDGMCVKDWAELYDELKTQLKDMEDPPNVANREIAVYSEKVDEEDEDHVYEYIEPLEFISFTKLAKENATDDEKFTIPHSQKGKSLVHELKQKLKLTTEEEKQSPSCSRSISESGTKPKPPPLPARSTSRVEKMRKTSGGEPEHQHLSGVSIKGIGEILKLLRLEKHIDKFRKEMVDGEITKSLTEDILKEEFNFSQFEVIKFMKYVHTGHIPQ